MDRAPSRRRAAGGAPPRPPRRDDTRRPRRPPRPPQQPAPRRTRPKNRPRRRPAPTVAVKLIVRRLPPTLSADAFNAAANKHGADVAVWRSYAPGSVESTGSVKRTAYVRRHSVAYLGFEKLEEAVRFHDAFNGLKFVDPEKTASGNMQTGADYYARVERAMWQSVPPLHKRNPPAITGTIESDPDYQAFLKALEGEQRERPISLGHTSAMFPSPAEDKRKQKQVVTPLMEDVRARRKEREEKKKVKPTSRGGRKGRQVVEQKPPEPTGKPNARRKKRRGSEAPSGGKREEAPTPEKRSPAAKPAHNDRRNGTFPRRDADAKSASSAQSGAAAKTPSSLVSTGPAEPASASSGGKGGKGGASNRSRYGRGPRSKAKFNAAQNANGNAPGKSGQSSSDSMNGAVRLLKKEASNTSKT